MDYGKLEKAKAEARRFLEAADRVKKIERADKNHFPRVWVEVESYTKENGSCLRASMDLTRALAELRKP